MWAALAVVFAFSAVIFVTVINFAVEHWYVAGPVAVALGAFALLTLTSSSWTSRRRPS